MSQLVMRRSNLNSLPALTPPEELIIHTEDERSKESWERIISDAFGGVHKYDMMTSDPAYAPDRVYFVREHTQDAAVSAAFTRAVNGIPGVRVSANDAGLHALITHAFLSESEMLARAEGAGIRLSGLSGYCHRAAPMPSTVVSGFAGLNLAQIGELAALLADAWGVRA